MTPPVLSRRSILRLGGAFALLPETLMPAAAAPSVTLLTAPISLGGAWRGSAPADALAVIERMRAACLDGIRLASDRQPEFLRVDDNPSGPPHVWLHADKPRTAVIDVDTGTRAWCQLAYQFGHELGHVMANSWMWGDEPRNPCQWLEEAVVESVSLRGLGRLAASWQRDPPFPHNNAYAADIRAYRANALGADRRLARDQGADAGLAAWFAAHAEFLATHGTVTAAWPAVPSILRLLDDDAAVADIGALNRWPERSHLPLQSYLDRWERSCAELGLDAVLPTRLRRLLLHAN